MEAAACRTEPIRPLLSSFCQRLLVNYFIEPSRTIYKHSLIFNCFPCSHRQGANVKFQVSDFNRIPSCATQPGRLMPGGGHGR